MKTLLRWLRAPFTIIAILERMDARLEKLEGAVREGDFPHTKTSIRVVQNRYE